MRKEVVDAAREYRFLLDRGYSQKNALDIISSKYMLSKRERLILYRSVHSSNYVRSVRRKYIRPFPGSKILVDGYNVFSTIYAMLCDEEVFLGDDGFLRDLLGLHRRLPHVLKGSTLYTILGLLEKYLSMYRTIIVFDSSVSHSGELASLVREYYTRKGINIEAIVVKKADKYIASTSIKDEIHVITSDAVVISIASKVYDLTGEIIRNTKPKVIIPVPVPDRIV